MATVRIGGTFGLPITADKLARYKELASGAPEKVRYWMNQMIKMVEVFQQTPDSKLASTPHPVGMGFIQPLEDEEVRRIWDYVPWQEELELISATMNTIKQDKQQRNGEKLEAWRQAVRQHVFAEHFPDESMAEFSKKNAAYKEAGTAIQRRVGDDEIALGALVQAFFPGQTVASHKARVAKFNDAVAAALDKSNSNPPVPKPVLEKTELLQAFGNLRWWAGQLCMDRQPCTSDLLKK